MNFRSRILSLSQTNQKHYSFHCWPFVTSDINDVDLYSGALAEQPSRATVGPTYVCLLGQQFANLRNCDRFWWENTDPDIGFATG